MAIASAVFWPSRAHAAQASGYEIACFARNSWFLLPEIVGFRRRQQRARRQSYIAQLRKRAAERASRGSKRVTSALTERI